MDLEAVNDRGEKGREPNVVRIEIGDDRPTARGETAIACRRRAAVRLRQQPNPRVGRELRDDVTRAITAAVIDDQELPVLKRLRADAGDRLANAVRAIPDRK